VTTMITKGNHGFGCNDGYRPFPVQSWLFRQRIFNTKAPRLEESKDNRFGFVSFVAWCLGGKDNSFFGSGSSALGGAR